MKRQFQWMRTPLARRQYSAYGYHLHWVAPPDLQSSHLGPELPEVRDADGLVSTRRHLHDGTPISLLNRAMEIVKPMGSALCEPIQSRLAYIHQQRGDYRSELDTLKNIPNPLHQSAAAIATYKLGRTDDAINFGLRLTTSDQPLLDSLRARAVYGVLARDSSSLETASELASALPGDCTVKAILKLLNAWVLYDQGANVSVALVLDDAISTLKNSNASSKILVPALQLSGIVAGPEHPNARVLFQQALNACEEANDMVIAMTESLRLLSLSYKMSGEAIIAEGLLRSAISRMTSSRYLSAPMLTALTATRKTYSDLLRDLEWNGVSRQADADRVLAECDADRKRCPFLNGDAVPLPEWIVQILTSD